MPSYDVLKVKANTRGIWTALASNKANNINDSEYKSNPMNLGIWKTIGTIDDMVPIIVAFMGTLVL